MGAEALTLTLNSVLDYHFESAVSTTEKKGDIHIVRNVPNGHYLSIIQMEERTEMWNGGCCSLFKKILRLMPMARVYCQPSLSLRFPPLSDGSSRILPGYSGGVRSVRFATLEERQLRGSHPSP
jgi:hypothetical protein